MNSIKRFITQHLLLKMLIIKPYSIFKKAIGYIFVLFFRIDNNKIVACNFCGKGYGDNPKYIIEEIIKQKLDYDIVWLTDKKYCQKNDFPESVRLVNYGSIKGLYEMATAKMWIDNSRKYYYSPKRRSQFYIQTWHGGIGIKLVEKGVEDKLGKIYIKNAKNDSKMADLFLSNSKWCTEFYRKNFWYKGEILECGSPRLDILFNNNSSIKEKIYNFYNIEKEKKILLYAPTFRNSMNLEVYNLDYKMCIDELKNKFGGEWIIFIRLHPNMYHLADKVSINSSIINVTQYSDMQELLSISDVLITDFSNSIFEFSYVKKPVFIFASDYYDYIKEREFTMDFEKLPFKVNKSNEELINDIKKFNEQKYYIKVEKMLKEFGVRENGNASKLVVEKIKEIM